MPPKNSDIYALLRISFPAFVEKVFETLHPGQTLHDTWHIEAICHALTRVAEGDSRRLMINVPPRTLKSMIASIAWPAFLLGHNPAIQIMVVSHNLDLATDLSNKFRQIVEAGWYKEAFPTMSGAPQKDNERAFITSLGGKRIAVSVNGSVKGIGADVIVLDDPVDAADFATESACDKVNHWIDAELSTRFNDPATSPMVLVMQRLSLQDPAAHLAEQEEWEKLSLPARAETDISVPLPLSRSHDFKKGELLDPVRLPGHFLEAQCHKMGREAYLAQYQQSPVPGGGGMIDLALFQRYTDLPKPFDVRFLSIDAASGEQSGSYSVIQVFQVTDGHLYLCQCHRGYWPFPSLRNLVIDLQKQVMADFIVVEKAHSGYALLEVLWDHYPAEVRSKLLEARSPKGSKEDRMAKALVLAEQGLVLFPEAASWMPEFTAELLAFPAGANDDQVDALSQGILFYKNYLDSHYNPNRTGGGKVIAPRAPGPS